MTARKVHMNLIVEALSMMVLFMSFTHIILVSVGKPELSYFEIVNKKLFIKNYVFDKEQDKVKLPYLLMIGSFALLAFGSVVQDNIFIAILLIEVICYSISKVIKF